MVQDSRVDGSRQKARKIMKVLYPDLQSNQIVHHVDGNPFNNNIKNLCIVSQKEHLTIHRKMNPRKKTTKVFHITIPDRTYNLLKKQAEKEKLKIATLAAAILRKVLETEKKDRNSE